jgi:BirA family biotin operon repressor/biotin-[acetyl-CoA-carboxylase] ligase
VNIALLRQIQDADGAFVPLERFGPDLEAARSDLDGLAAYGFSIEIHPYLGVAYRGPAERLCPDQIEYGLEPLRVGRRIAVWNRVTSTNDLAARAAVSAANEGLVVLAEEQTAGRGRRGRNWSAPPRSSILMSVLLFPPESLADPPWLTALGAVATAEVVSEWTGRAAAIKWPNDVRVDGRKIAGILVERGEGAVVGIGLNANLTLDDMPDALRDVVTSLQILLGRAVDRSNLARDLIRRLDALYEQSRREGGGSLTPLWRGRSEHLGRQVEVTTPSGALRGRLDDLDLTAGLRLATADHAMVWIPARCVLEIRPLDSPFLGT